MHALLMPLRGFLNSLVYGLRGRKPPLCCLVLARKLPCIGKIFFFEEDLMEDEAEGYGIDLTRLKITYEEAAIFTTTFNLGECDLESLGDLGQWIPGGYDVYVVGLQEVSKEGGREGGRDGREKRGGREGSDFVAFASGLCGYALFVSLTLPNSHK